MLIRWLWRWLPLRLSKRQSTSTITVLLRTTLTWKICIHKHVTILLSSNHLLYKSFINFVGEMWEVLHCDPRYFISLKFHQYVAVDEFSTWLDWWRVMQLPMFELQLTFVNWNLRETLFLFLFVGPKPKTVNDFWRMIFEQKCPTIVMLTTLKEMGKVWKCYFGWFYIEDLLSFVLSS